MMVWDEALPMVSAPNGDFFRWKQALSASKNPSRPDTHITHIFYQVRPLETGCPFASFLRRPENNSLSSLSLFHFASSQSLPAYLTCTS